MEILSDVTCNWFIVGMLSRPVVPARTGSPRIFDYHCTANTTLSPFVKGEVDQVYDFFILATTNQPPSTL
jgi:hypothetical protein